MSFHTPSPVPRPPLRCEMRVLLTLNDRSFLVLRSSVMGLLSSCTHVPCPPSAPTGAKRALSASSSQASHGPEPGSQPLKTRTLSGMASKTTTTVTPKRIAHSPSLQVPCTLRDHEPYTLLILSPVGFCFGPVVCCLLVLRMSPSLYKHGKVLMPKAAPHWGIGGRIHPWPCL
jgi:hypothetical protein